jgi:hypothetical protein
MDHARVYEALMARAVGRIVDCYTEKHHIVPRCLGGPNTTENIVRLTGREHVMAHKLLVRMYPGNLKLWTAVMLMGRVKMPKARATAREREEFARLRREFRYSDEAKVKMSESAKKRGRNGQKTEFQQGFVPWNKGLKSWRREYSHSEETLAKMRVTQQANREAQSARMKQWWADRKLAISQIGG